MESRAIRFTVLLTSLFVTLACAPARAAEPAAASAPAAAKVVFQVSDGDPAKWNLALNNVGNARKELGESLVVEVVAFGPGIGMVKADSAVASRVRTALASGVRIVACENTMAAMKLTHDDMLAGMGFVPSGVVEIIERQRQGYAYVRP
jgi:intracellular sulfur oxidation DsrE/DsrF family protein